MSKFEVSLKIGSIEFINLINLMILSELMTENYGFINFLHQLLLYFYIYICQNWKLFVTFYCATHTAVFVQSSHVLKLYKTRSLHIHYEKVKVKKPIKYLLKVNLYFSISENIILIS